MKFVRLAHDTWVNPEQVTRVEQRGDNAIVYFTSGREKAMLNTVASVVVQKIEGESE